jgi:hypothetical protein
VPSDPVEEFVTRFYQLCLGRDSEPEGLNNWVDSLTTGVNSGADVAYGFVLSSEFNNRSTSNEEFVTILYQAFFNRDPDSGGYSYWVSQLNAGLTRIEVLDGFIYSLEFEILCDTYGISPYGGAPPAAETSDVEAFATRFYQQCLGREPDAPGLDGWVSALLNGTLSGADVAYNFIFSEEFKNQNTRNEDFVTILYRAFFGREPDMPGYNGWINALNRGVNRQDVLSGFIYSLEFENLCSSYGIAPYSS